MLRHRIEHLSFLIAAPVLLVHCSTSNHGGGGDSNSGGNSGTSAGAGGNGSGAGGASTGGSSMGGRATGGASGTGESGRAQGGAGGADSGGADSGGEGPGGDTSAGAGGSPMGGLGGVAGRAEGGQGGVGKGGAGAGGAGGKSGGAGGQGGAAGNVGGLGGKAPGGAGGAGGIGGSGGKGGVGGSGAGGGSGGGFTCNPACGAGQMCCPANALTTSCIAATSAGCLAPDLTISIERAEETAEVVFRNFSASHCALAEQCIGASGRRRLLRFETFTPNIGTADMRLGVPNTSNPVFEYSACHDHYHFKGYADYALLDASGTIVATGHKQAFCLLDSERYLTNDNTVRRTPQFQCNNQGITRGWGDSYTPDLDCQWIDVTDVPPGDYQLRIRINQERTLLELRYDNNEVLVPVRIP